MSKEHLEGAPVISAEYLTVCGSGAIILLGTLFLKDFFVSRAYKKFKRLLPNSETRNVSVKILQLNVETGWDEGALAYVDGTLYFQGHNSRMQLLLRDFQWKSEGEILTLDSGVVSDLNIIFKDQGPAFGMIGPYPTNGFRIWELEAADSKEAALYPPLTVRPEMSGSLLLTGVMILTWLSMTGYILTRPPLMDWSTAVVLAICLLPQLGLFIYLLYFFKSTTTNLKSLHAERSRTLTFESVTPHQEVTWTNQRAE